MNMINGMLAPLVQGQPAPIAANLQWWIGLTTRHLVALSWSIALLQVVLGLCFLFGRWVRPAVVVSIIWAAGVWYVGEGQSSLLTGQASALTGAPGSVVFYAVLALIFFLNGKDPARGPAAPRARRRVRQVLASFWVFAALLQLQPYWRQAKQISR